MGKKYKKGHQAIIKSCGYDNMYNLVLHAVENQKIPFDKITIIKDVTPESVAQNMAIDAYEYEWIWGIDGDMVLGLNSIERWNKYVTPMLRPDVVKVQFGVYDCFLKRVITGLGIKRADFYSQFPFPDELMNDRCVSRKIARANKKIINMRNKGKFAIATHFCGANIKQIFCRFYARGVKAHHTEVAGDKRFLAELRRKFEESGDLKYHIAVRAFRQGFKTGLYPGSHNVEFDSQVYNSWAEANQELINQVEKENAL